MESNRRTFLLVCYKENRESKYKTKSYFENVKRHITGQKMKHMILIGDLKGRIGTTNDKTPGIDLSKTFDSMPINRIKIKLRKTLPPDSKMLSLIIKILSRKYYKGMHNGDETQPFKSRNGIPQSDSMSPTLFSLYINDLIESFRENEDTTDPLTGNKMKISNVTYADDILFMSQSP